MKSEPNVWSIDQQKKAGHKGIAWDGVRNYQAANNLKKMQKGDLCFFYHSNIGKEIVGIVEVIKTAFLDKTDKKVVSKSKITKKSEKDISDGSVINKSEDKSNESKQSGLLRSRSGAKPAKASKKTQDKENIENIETL